MAKRKLFLTLILAVKIAAAATSQVIFVNASVAGAGTGQSWSDAFKDLHAALQQAQPGDAVWVAQGHFYPDSAMDRNRYFALKSGVKLFGGFEGNEQSLSERQIDAHPVILSGNIGNLADSTDNAYTILYLDHPDTNTLINGIIFEHGYARSDTNSDLSSPASNGGAVFINAKNGKALPVFENCVFRSNVARFNGGAVFVNGQNTSGSTPIFRSCRFINNRSRLGGGVYLYGGNAYDRGIEFDSCTFKGNWADFHGGALYIRNHFGDETYDFWGCEIVNNDCDVFGAFFNFEKYGTNSFRLNIEFCNVTSNGPDAKNLVTLISNTGLPYVYQSVFNVKNSIFHNNICSFSGTNETETTLLNIENLQNVDLKDTVNFIGNLFENNIAAYWLYFSSIPSLSISENVFHFNSFSPISWGYDYQFTKNIVVGSTSISGCGGSSITNCNISNNVFMPIKGVGLLGYWGLADTIKISNNLFYQCDTAIAFGYPGIDFASIPSHAYFFNNIFHDCTNLIERHPIDTVAYAYFYNNLFDQSCEDFADPITICGTGNVVNDNPQFVDPVSRDFRLLPCSPAIDAGNNTIVQELGLLTDFADAPRIQGGTVDIGPYEAATMAATATTHIQAACAGSAGGSITVYTPDGCVPLVYDWEPPVANGATATELPPGSYAVTVTDSRGRSFSDTLTVAPAPSPEVSAQATPVVCTGDQGGTATALATGGATPYEYLWSTGDTLSQLAQLPAGLYLISVTDALGCQDTATVVVSTVGNLTLEVDGTLISCHGAADGRLRVAALTGQAPYSYTWTPALPPDSVQTNLGPGAYTVTVTDFNACTSTFTFNLADPAELSVVAFSSPSSSTQQPNGTATAAGQGGTQPYTYAWSAGATGTTVNQLLPGVYTVTATDSQGCTAVTTVEVLFVSSAGEAETTQVRVWPNPAGDWLTVETLEPTGPFLLHDAAGRQVLSRPLTAEKTRLEVSGLPAGTYVWRCGNWSGVVEKI